MKRLTSQSLFIGTSDEAIKLVRLISLCADSDASILIQGETGSGKEVVCGELHRQSPRSSNNLVGINCAAIPAQLLESELFGHKKVLSLEPSQTGWVDSSWPIRALYSLMK